MISGVLRLRWMFCFLLGITALSVSVLGRVQVAFAEDIEYTITDLGIGYVFSRALDINNSGEVVGYIQTNTQEDHAFLWSNGVMSDLGTLGGTLSYAHAINDKGEVIGEFWSGVNSKSFLYKDGVMNDLGTLGGTTSSQAWDINKKGQITGSYDYAGYYKPFYGNSEIHAFLYSDGVINDLGTLGGPNSWAYDINKFGHVVGMLGFPTGWGRAFLYKDGEMKDLNSLVKLDTGWILSEATGINDFGQIVGLATVYGYGHAFLLSPVPTPHHAAPLDEWVGGIGGGWEEEVQE